MRTPSYRQSKSVRTDRRSPAEHSRFFWVALALGVAVFGASTVAQDARASDPTAPIEQLDAALLAAMKAGQNTPFMQRYALLGPAVEQAFDLNALLRGAVGFGWDRLPGNEKAALTSTFRRYTVSNYAANFDSYDGQSFRVLPDARALSNGDVVVRTQITRPAKPPVEIDYVVRQTREGWRVVDVLANGTISQVAVQRSDFGGLLASGGAPALRAGLERKVSILSGDSSPTS